MVKEEDLSVFRLNPIDFGQFLTKSVTVHSAA
jgi:hypothetical protein